MRTEVTTAFGVEGTVDAVKKINNRTAWINARGKETREYDKARKKVTLPMAVTDWLNKPMPD